MRNKFLAIDFRIKDNSLYYNGTIQDNYNAFLVVTSGKLKPATFQIAYTESQREPAGKISGAIALEKGRNIVTVIVKDFEGKEVYREKKEFDIC